MALTKLSRGVLYAIYFLVVAGLAVVIAVSFHSSPKPKTPTHQSIAHPSGSGSHASQGAAKPSAPASSGSSSATGSLSNTGPGDSALVGFMVAVPVGYFAHRQYRLRQS